MTKLDVGFAGIVWAGTLGMAFILGSDYRRTHTHAPIHYTEKPFYVQEPDPRMTFDFDKDGIVSIVLIDQKGKVWGRISPFEKDCQFGKGHIYNCAVEGRAGYGEGLTLGPGDSATF